MLAQFYYQITYRLGKENAITNILSQKDELTPIQKSAKEAKKTRLVFPLEAILALIENTKTIDDLRVTDKVLQANRTDLSLALEQTRAQEKTAP